MEKIKVHSNKHKISGMAWSPDCRFILTWGDDNSVIINSVFSLRLY
jgi:WD40 repeat protein